MSILRRKAPKAIIGPAFSLLEEVMVNAVDSFDAGGSDSIH